MIHMRRTAFVTTFSVLMGAVLFASSHRSAFAQDGSSTEPKDLPLKARLIAGQQAYPLDLGGKTAEQFAKLLDDVKVKGTALPVPPAVNLTLEFTNTGKKDLHLCLGRGDIGPVDGLAFDLKGPGVLRASFANARGARVPPTVVTVPAGKTHSVPITKLEVYDGRSTQAWYWSKPGEYTLSASCGVVDGGDKGFWKAAGKIVTAPIKLNVGGKASAAVRIGDLDVVLQPIAEIFPLKDPLSFDVKLTNMAKAAVQVQVTTSINQTLGTYTYSVRNVDNQKTWSVVSVHLPKGFLGPPTSIGFKTIEPGQTLATRIRFPTFGLGLKSAKGDLIEYLPAGSYELTLTLDIANQGKGTTRPAAFRVSEKEMSVANLPGLPKGKIAAIAQKFFAERFEITRKNSKNAPWDALKVDSFQAEIVAGRVNWQITYTAELKEPKRRVTLHFAVDASGRVQAIPGFVISSTDRPLPFVPGPRR